MKLFNQKKHNVTLGHQAHHKIVFAGTFGVGKTTALRAVSDIEVANTDVNSLEITDELRQAGKTTTTVGFDYGELHLPDKTRVELYGLPGQERFDLIWDNLLNKDTGILLWLYGDKPDALDECKTWLDILASRSATRKLCVALTRLPTPTPSMLLAPFRELIMQYNPYAPVMSADPREKSQVEQAILMAVGTPAFEQ